MNMSSRIAAAILIAAGVLMPVFSLAATPAEKAPAASRFYALLGHWKGKGQLIAAGEAPITLALKVSCVKAASGWAVHCDMVARNAKMTITESDLFGVDAATGTGHWYAVTNQGEVNDLVTQWTNTKTMVAHRAWMQDGKQMDEKVIFTLPRKTAMKFSSTVTAFGKKVDVFSGELTR